jgi:hypothetical protein
MNWRACAAAVAALWVLGCGGGEAASETAQGSRASGGERASGAEADGAQMTGLMGTIPRHEVENTLNPRMGRFSRCFEHRMGAVEFLGGNIRMSFRIRTDGTVAWVYPSQSDVGDRGVEQCVLSEARSTRFPRPRGGEAEFSWGFGFDAPDDVRPPLNWTADALGNQLSSVGELVSACNANGSYEVTAYVEPGGRVLAAGGSAPSAEDEAVLDCILERVRAWSMPDPGSYPAKITFAVR